MSSAGRWGVLLMLGASAAAAAPHSVVAGESLARIAERYYGAQDWPRLFQANRAAIRDPALIYPGQILDIPEAPAPIAAALAPVPPAGAAEARYSGVSRCAGGLQVTVSFVHAIASATLRELRIAHECVGAPPGTPINMEWRPAEAIPVRAGRFEHADGFSIRGEILADGSASGQLGTGGLSLRCSDEASAPDHPACDHWRAVYLP